MLWLRDMQQQFHLSDPSTGEALHGLTLYRELAGRLDNWKTYQLWESTILRACRMLKKYQLSEGISPVL